MVSTGTVPVVRVLREADQDMILKGVEPHQKIVRHEAHIAEVLHESGIVRVTVNLVFSLRLLISSAQARLQSLMILKAIKRQKVKRGIVGENTEQRRRTWSLTA